jgi:hypothetical protein
MGRWSRGGLIELIGLIGLIGLIELIELIEEGARNGL